nr:MAG TPA: hypothetical protein [Caudoviricetes sp.]
MIGHRRPARSRQRPAQRAAPPGTLTPRPRPRRAHSGARAP